MEVAEKFPHQISQPEIRNQNMSPNNGIYPRKQKPKTHMCIGKDLLHDGEPYNQQHQHRHQATLQPAEAVRRAMGNHWAQHGVKSG